MEKNNPESIILKILLKQFSLNWTITHLSRELNITRVGIWKILKKIKNQNMIILDSIGQGKTSAFSVRLNWENPILEKKLSLILTEEALKHQRWMTNFDSLKNSADFIILYGSILHTSKEAKDIDILNVVSNKNNFLDIEKKLQNIQKTQIKKIHSENFTISEFRQEIKKPNKIFIDAIKKGVVLFGQEKFIKFIKSI